MSQSRDHPPPSAAAPTPTLAPKYGQDLWDRFTRSQQVNDTKDAIILDALTRLDVAEAKVDHNVCDRREAHIENDLVRREEEIAHLQRLLNRDPFVLVLVDASTIAFTDAYIGDGERGGRHAALVLRDEVTEWAATAINELPEGFKVQVKVYADYGSLARSLMSAGTIDNASKIGDFARGFNSLSLFEFLEIGTCDVDGKIIDSYKLLIGDYHCRQVIVGGKHGLLKEYINNEEAKHRTTLLQAAPVPVASDQSRPFPTAFFPRALRDQKSATSIGAVIPLPAVGRKPAASIGHAGPLDSPAMTVASLSAPGSWAARASAAATLPQTTLTAAKKIVNAGGPVARFNKSGHRIDPPISSYDRIEIQRIKKMHLCNLHYLHPEGCPHRKKCTHDHAYKVSETELENLKSIARETVCRDGLECADPLCVCGHHCPYPVPGESSMRGQGCINGGKCRFPPEMHGAKDTVVVSEK